MALKEYPLTNEGIRSVTEEIRQYFADRKASETDILRLSLLIEEAMLRYRDRFGNHISVQIDTSPFLINKVVLRMKGEHFNPLQEEENSILGSAFLNNLMETERITAAFRYQNGCNELVLIAPWQVKELKIPGGAITLAVLSAAAAAFLTGFLPPKTAAFLVNDLAVPLFSRLMKVIVLVTGPLICISVISGICALGDIATLSSVGLRVIRRFVVIIFLMTLFCGAVGFLFFPGFSAGTAGAFDPSVFINMFLDLLPQDLVSPFVESQSIQIIVIAAVYGAAILMLDEKVPMLRGLITEINQVLFTIMGIVSKIIPLTVFLSIYKAASQNSLSSILTVWKFVAANFVSIIPFTLLMVLYVCFRRKLDVRKFLKDISEPAGIGFTTGSSTLAMPKEFEAAENHLKIDKKLTSFWIPLSHAMFSPSVVPPLVIAAFYAASYYHTPLTLPQIVILIILVIQLSIASPKVPGGIMATYSILLAQLGMPADIVGLLMIANVFILNVETGLSIIIRMTELKEFSCTAKNREKP